jgi:hypothetical protein
LKAGLQTNWKLKNNLQLAMRPKLIGSKRDLKTHTTTMKSIFITGGKNLRETFGSSAESGQSSKRTCRL